MALYKVVFDFDGQEATELSVRKGDLVVAQGEPQDDWLLVAKQSHPATSGYVPIGYVERLPAAAANPPAPAPVPGPSALTDSLFDFPSSGPAASPFGGASQADSSAAFPPFGFSASPNPERSGPSLFQPSSTPFASDPPSFTPPAFPGASDPFGGSPPFGFPANGHSAPFGSSPAPETAAPQQQPQPQAFPDTWPFPGGLPREPVPSPPPAVVYPVLPAVQPMEVLRRYEEAYKERMQVSAPDFAAFDTLMADTCANLQQARRQHHLASGQLHRVRTRLEVDGGALRRHKAAVHSLNVPAHASPPPSFEDLSFPPIDFAYRKFLTPGRQYDGTDAAPTPGPSAPPAPAFPSSASGPSASPATPEFGAFGGTGPTKPDAFPPAPVTPTDETESPEAEAFGRLDRAAVAVQKVRDDLEVLALTPLAEAMDPNSVVKARKAYDELLLQQMMKVDAVDSHGIAVVRQRRKDMLRDIEKLHGALDDLNKRENAHY